MANAPDINAKRKRLIERRHPEYSVRLPHWEFCEQTYEGGRDWFHKNISQYVKEGPKEYMARLLRAYRFNHTREIVDLIQKYIFKSNVARNEVDASSEIKSFWKSATRAGLTIDQYMRIVSTKSSIFGRIWVFVDSNKTENVVSRADEKALGAKVYSYIVRPIDMLDFGFDDNGALDWCLVRETHRDDLDPLESTGDVQEKFRLWTKTSWTLFRTEDKKGAGRKVERQIIVEKEGKVTIGRVPCFPVDNVIGDNKYSSPALINDIAYLDRAVANYLSNLDAIIQDQTFSQLAMPAQAMLPGDDKYEKLVEMGTKRVFLYDGEGAAVPFYLSPDVKQAEIIVTVINKIIGEIYHSVGMSGERTNQDNAAGTDTSNSSGVAKAYDFERLNSLLTTKSAALQNAELHLIELVNLYHGVKPKKKADDERLLVKYADTFDVRSLFDEFTVADRLATVQAPDLVRQEQMKQVIDKLFPALAKDLRDKMLADLTNWPLDPIEQAGKLAQATASAMPTAVGDKGKTSNSANKNPQTQKRQGQVTSQTK